MAVEAGQEIAIPGSFIPLLVTDAIESACALHSHHAAHMKRARNTRTRYEAIRQRELSKADPDLRKLQRASETWRNASAKVHQTQILVRHAEIILINLTGCKIEALAAAGLIRIA